MGESKKLTRNQKIAIAGTVITATGVISTIILSYFSLQDNTKANLANIGPFVDATNQLEVAVAQSGSIVSDELRYTGSKEVADKLDEVWKITNYVFETMTAYSNSLESIVSSGNQGARTAGELADSVQGFAETIGIVTPASPDLIKVPNDSFKLLIQYIDNTRAAKSMEEAMVKAQPAVELIVKLIMDDLEGTDDIFRTANKIVEINFKNSYAYHISYRKVLEDLLMKADITDVNDAVLKRLAQVNSLLDSTNYWYSEYQRGLEENQKRLRIGRLLVKRARDSVQQWISAHEQVVNALKNKRPVNTKSLQETIVEIQDISKRLFEL